MGKRLQAIRDSYGLTRKDWAAALGLGEDVIFQYENGARGVPFYVLARVALVAQIPIGLLLLGRISPITDKRIEGLNRTHPVMKETEWKPKEEDCRAVKAIQQLAGS